MKRNRPNHCHKLLVKVFCFSVEFFSIFSPFLLPNVMFKVHERMCTFSPKIPPFKRPVFSQEKAYMLVFYLFFYLFNAYSSFMHLVPDTPPEPHITIVTYITPRHYLFNSAEKYPCAEKLITPLLVLYR